MTLVAANWRDPSLPLALGLMAAPCLAIYGSLGLAPLYAICTVWALAVGWTTRPWRHVPPATTATLGLFCLFAVISVLWAIDTRQSVRTAAVLVLECGGGIMLVTMARMLDDDRRRLIGRALAVGLVLGLSFLLIEKFTPGFRFVFAPRPEHLTPKLQQAGLQRSETVHVLLLLPMLTFLVQNGMRWLAAVYLAAFLLAIGLGSSLAAKLAVVLALAVWVLHSWRPRLTTWGVGLLFVLAIASQPLHRSWPHPQVIMDEAHSWLPNSAHHRITIWRFGAEKAMEKPVLGWGLDASRAIPGGEDEMPIDLVERGNLVRMREQLMPLHPHNGALQWWLELGGVGAGLAGLFLYMVVAQAGRVPGLAGGMMLGTLSAGLLISLVSYGIWQSWWQAALWLAAAAAAAVAPTNGGDRRGP